MIGHHCGSLKHPTTILRRRLELFEQHDRLLRVQINGRPFEHRTSRPLEAGHVGVVRRRMRSVVAYFGTGALPHVTDEAAAVTG
jgi:hypothetical protein